MDQSILQKYARLIAKMGVNVQKGQEVRIRAELDQPEFVRVLVEECYSLGADRVVVDWCDQQLTATDYRWRTLESLSALPEDEEAKWKHYVHKLPCRIYLESEDPDGLAGVDQEKMAKAAQNRYPLIKGYRDEMENHYQWCIAAVPGKAWAKKVFPSLPTEEAMEKLWQAILSTSRVTEDPVAEWEKHNAELKARCEYLNSLGIEKLHYTSPSGTDLTVGMIPQAVFRGGADCSRRGIWFNPNIPTEECFISPMRGEAEGLVYATKPLCYEGQLIENFWIRFSEGKAVEWHAEKNGALLDKMIRMDEGSAYLGECALVPDDSPISRGGVLFYNTLFDENAACHLALGMGFEDTIQNYEKYTLEECRAMGVNDSMIHEDFMIGSPELNIDAILRDGRVVPIFRHGLWAF